MVKAYDFARYYPILNFISTETLHNLDFEELYVPNPCEIILINDLAERLNKFVILYKSGYKSKPNSFTKHLAASELSGSEASLVQSLQAKLSSFCRLAVYDKPLLYKL